MFEMALALEMQAMSSMTQTTHTNLVAKAASSWCVQGLGLATYTNRQPSFDRGISKPEEGE